MQEQNGLVIITNIYNLFRISLLHMHKKCFFFQIRSMKKPLTFFKNGCKKIVFITKCNEKNCLKHITL